MGHPSCLDAGCLGGSTAGSSEHRENRGCRFARDSVKPSASAHAMQSPARALGSVCSTSVQLAEVRGEEVKISVEREQAKEATVPVLRPLFS